MPGGGDSQPAGLPELASVRIDPSAGVENALRETPRLERRNDIKDHRAGSVRKVVLHEVGEGVFIGFDGTAKTPTFRLVWAAVILVVQVGDVADERVAGDVGS